MLHLSTPEKTTEVKNPPYNVWIFQFIELYQTQCIAGVFSFPYNYKQVSRPTEHINHVRKVAGIDHVGIGADFDGINK